MPIRFSMTPRLLALALGAFATLLAVVFVIGMRVGQAIQGATHAAPSAPAVRQAIDPRTLITPPTITPPTITPPTITPPPVAPPPVAPPPAPVQPPGR